MDQHPRRRVCGTIRGSDFAILSLVMALGSLVASSVGCSSDSSRTGSATGGSVGTGGGLSSGGVSDSGALGTGGSSVTGGSPGSGGATSAGSDAGIGGDAPLGGAPGSGGVRVTGGSSGTGGATTTGADAGTGGDASIAGAPESGGASGSGGKPGAGGATGSGGSPSAGGATGAGGALATGGATGSGGKSGSGGATGAGGVTGTGGAIDAGSTGETRDPRLWPFAATSIWNMPIGSAAVYVPAQIKQATGMGMSVDEDIIIVHPESPLTDVQTNTADWDNTKDRCPGSSPTIMSVPIPASWVFKPILPDTPNAAAAILLANGHTVKQTQPLSRCTASGAPTSHYTFADVDLSGDGITGAHGGSGLSALGGTLRIGELRPSSGNVRHVLKVEMWKAENYFTCASGAACQYRWPATSGETNTAGTSVSAMREGSLLALPATLDITTMGLETEPAKRLAWTLQNYGGYVVDDTAWSVYAIAVETGPDGKFLDQFQQDWGFAIKISSKNTPWGRDMDRLFLALAAVDNNTATSVGGGGTPRQPLAPPFASQ